jgi:hypothetical protein
MSTVTGSASHAGGEGLKDLETLRMFVHFEMFGDSNRLSPNEVNSDKQQGRPEQLRWGDRVVRETQSTEVIDDQRADQLPGDDGSKRGAWAPIGRPGARALAR